MNQWWPRWQIHRSKRSLFQQTMFDQQNFDITSGLPIGNCSLLWDDPLLTTWVDKPASGFGVGFLMAKPGEWGRPLVVGQIVG